MQVNVNLVKALVKSLGFVPLEGENGIYQKVYAPSCIELEKTYPSGHGHSGRLDIVVTYADKTPFLMAAVLAMC